MVVWAGTGDRGRARDRLMRFGLEYLDAALAARRPKQNPGPLSRDKANKIDSLLRFLGHPCRSSVFAVDLGALASWVVHPISASGHHLLIDNL